MSTETHLWRVWSCPKHAVKKEQAQGKLASCVLTSRHDALFTCFRRVRPLRVWKNWFALDKIWSPPLAFTVKLNFSYYLSQKLNHVTHTPHRWEANVVFFFPRRDNIDDFKVQTAKHPNIASAPLRPHTEQSKDRASKRLSTESNGTSEGGQGSSTPVELTALEEAFRRFAIHGDTRATGKEMHGKNWSKLCKDCGVIDGKNITLTDVDIVFSKVK